MDWSNILVVVIHGIILNAYVENLSQGIKVLPIYEMVVVVRMVLPD